MSEIIHAIKDAVNPERREQATVPTYDAQKRGPYPSANVAGSSQPELKPPTESQNPSRAEQTYLSTSNPRSGPGTSQGVHNTTKLSNDDSQSK